MENWKTLPTNIRKIQNKTPNESMLMLKIFPHYSLVGAPLDI